MHRRQQGQVQDGDWCCWAPPESGKGTQADLLNKKLEACHLSTGDLFRAASKLKAEDQSPAMRAAMEHMRRGELVPDSTVWEMVRERAGCIRCSAGFVLDGFPRTLAQAESLKQLMETEKIPLHAVVNYELPLGRDRCPLKRPPHLREMQSRLPHHRQPSESRGRVRPMPG